MSFRDDEYPDTQALLRADYSPERELVTEVSQKGFDSNPVPAIQQSDETQSWYDKAPCRGLTHLFFGPAGEKKEQKDQREQKARIICLSCVVIENCAEAAQRQYGFWAGTSEEDRFLRDKKMAPLSYSVPVRLRRQKLKQDKNAS